MYDSVMSVNKKFKSSVNLQYDLYNEDKILQYVPTTDLCDVISYYIDSVIDNGKKSTFLAGPYGKGKSYLMLMITYLLSKRENKELLKKVVNKISKINKDLSKKIEYLEKNKISLLPVIISNNNSDNLNHNFLLSLRNALMDHGIENIIPSSAYSEAIEIVNEWEKQNSASFDIFKECKTSLDIDFAKLKSGLLKFEEESFENFKKLFKCVNHGYQYNTLVSSDFSLTYTDVSKKIKEYGFDEKFMLNTENKTIEEIADEILGGEFMLQSKVPKSHCSGLQKLYFDKVVSGEKTIEGRLHDEKRQGIHEGDAYVFGLEPGRREMVRKVVKKKTLFKNFNEFCERVDPVKAGFSNKQEMQIVYNTIYSKEMQEKYGVVAIEVE